MTDPSLDIGRATEADVAGILELQAANQQACGGMLSAELPRGRVEAMMRSMPLIVARRSGRVVGFLMATTQDMNSGLAVVRAMFDAYPSSPESYVYGPICVDPSERGQGLAAAMFAVALEPGREGVLFIRSDNAPSLLAHRKMGMSEVAHFELGRAHFAVFSYPG